MLCSLDAVVTTKILPGGKLDAIHHYHHHKVYGRISIVYGVMMIYLNVHHLVVCRYSYGGVRLRTPNGDSRIYVGRYTNNSARLELQRENRDANRAKQAVPARWLTERRRRRRVDCN